MAVCRSCRRPVMWVETEATEKKAGRKMPLDADADGRPLAAPDGNIMITDRRTGDGTPIVRYLPKAAAPTIARYVSHFATCPHAKEHRRG